MFLDLPNILVRAPTYVYPNLIGMDECHPLLLPAPKTKAPPTSLDSTLEPFGE